MPKTHDMSLFAMFFLLFDYIQQLISGIYCYTPSSICSYLEYQLRIKIFNTYVAFSVIERKIIYMYAKLKSAVSCRYSVLLVVPPREIEPHTGQAMNMQKIGLSGFIIARTQCHE